jgi:hypothetical protein
MDLPFAIDRWTKSESITHKTRSSHRSEEFGVSYGTLSNEWRMLQRAVFVIDGGETARHSEYVGDQATEPDYDAALKVARRTKLDVRTPHDADRPTKVHDRTPQFCVRFRLRGRFLGTCLKFVVVRTPWSQIGDDTGLRGRFVVDETSRYQVGRDQLNDRVIPRFRSYTERSHEPAWDTAWRSGAAFQIADRSLPRLATSVDIDAGQVVGLR